MPIKRHKALQPLSRDHHQGLILAQILKKGAPQYKGMPSTIEGKKEYAIAFSESELKQHFMMIVFSRMSSETGGKGLFLGVHGREGSGLWI